MEEIEFEFYSGNENLLLILTGIGGTTKGYQNKYETIAKKVLKDFGFSVVVATTPHGSWEHTKENLEKVISFINSKIQVKDIYAMGSSAGANILLWHCSDFPQIKRILAINPVMNINIHLVKNIALSTAEMICIVCGENDFSSKYALFIPKNKNIEIIILPNIDHNFTNHLDTFLDLPFKFLYK